MSEVRSALVWERGSMGLSPLTVTLQQLKLQEKQLILALVCESGEGGSSPQLPAGYLCESMVGWFHGEFLAFCRANPEAGWERMRELMQKQCERTLEEWKDYAGKKNCSGEVRFSGVLLWDRHFVAFGNLPVYVLNCRFNRPRKKNIFPVGEKMSFITGEIRSFSTIYLENGVMAERIKEEEVLESLYTEKSMEEMKLERRLSELGRAAKERSGGKSTGAVVLEVKPC